MKISAEDLAEYRGCISYWNDCWPECVESAQYTLDERPEWAAQEIEQAQRWWEAKRNEAVV